VVVAAQTLTISSSSALDTLAGTGAQIVQVTYIKWSDGAEVVANYNMNGITGVNVVVADGYAVNDVRVVQVGATGSNQGVIYVGYGTITAGVPQNILSSVVALANRAQQLIYTVPTGKSFELLGFIEGILTASYISLRYRPTKLSNIVYTEFDLPLNSSTPRQSPFPSPFPAGSQLQIWTRTSTGAGATGLIFSGYLRSV
jgi:hypothetical protein